MAAIEVISLLKAVDPNVVRLARGASLAARIEPPLLRRLRLALLPRSDAGLEADLRFSPLTRSHNASSIVLRADVVEHLRQELGAPAYRAFLSRARAIVEAAHASAPAIIQLEEKVTWLALSGEASAAELDAELMRAVQALAHDDRAGIATWAARALPRLPVAARRSEAAWLLAAGTMARLGGGEVLKPGEAVEMRPELLEAVLPAENKTASIGVRLLEGGVEFGGVALPGAKLLRVPNASPVRLELQWLYDDENEPRAAVQAVFPLGERQRVAGAELFEAAEADLRGHVRGAASVRAAIARHARNPA